MDRQVEHCLSCGHALGIGRFCVNCGHPKGGPTEGVPQSPVPPPPVHEPPRPARYPLFADEAATGSLPTHGAPVEPPAHQRPDLPPTTSESPTLHRRTRPTGLWWVAGAAAVIVLFGAGGALLLNNSDSPDSPAAAATDSANDGVSPSVSEPVDPTSAPTDEGSNGGEEGEPPDGPIDVANLAEATPPDTASPSRDVNGNAVRYEAFNMLDGQPDTAWRMPGDGSGQEVVFRLDSPTTIGEVGLINGYAKVDPGYNGYTANRRIKSVEWVFGDGTVIRQDLTDNLAMQSVPVDDIVSDIVTLRIVKVSQPAQGPDGRDYTAISDVALVGTPA